MWILETRKHSVHRKGISCAIKKRQSQAGILLSFHHVSLCGLVHIHQPLGAWFPCLKMKVDSVSLGVWLWKQRVRYSIHSDWPGRHSQEEAAAVAVTLFVGMWHSHLLTAPRHSCPKCCPRVLHPLYCYPYMLPFITEAHRCQAGKWEVE